MEDFKKLAKQGQIETTQGRRKAETIWHVNVIREAQRDAKKLFRKLSKHALAAAMDQTRCLALFPDRRTEIGGQLYDVKYEKIVDEIFYRLTIDDDLFGGNSLRAFFWPQFAIDEKEAPGAIWVIGFEWRKDAYRHRLAIYRKRIRELGRPEGEPHDSDS